MPNGSRARSARIRWHGLTIPFPNSIQHRFAMVSVIFIVVAIALISWMTAAGIFGGRHINDEVILSVAIDNQMDILQKSLLVERTEIAEQSGSMAAEISSSTLQAEDNAIATIQVLAAGRPDIIRALDNVNAVVSTWRHTYSAVSSVKTTAAAAEAAFAPVTAAIGALVAAYQSPISLITAANTQSEWLRVMELIIVILILFAILMLIAYFARRWIFTPVADLIAVSTTLREGGSATFQTSGSEIGQLGTEIDRMYRALDIDVKANTVVNRFVERVVMEEDDRGVAEGLVVAFDELITPDRISVHISNQSQDRAILQASKGEVNETVVSFHGMDRCPGVRRSILYTSLDATDRQTVICPLFPTTAGTLVHVPLIDRDCVGVAHLAWDAPNMFDDHSSEVIHRLMGRAALSIANRRMVMGLQRSANTDARTGLLNSRAFDDIVESMMHDAPLGEPSSILMLDVDHFKDFNDRFGHAAGDEALRILSAVLREQVRDGDITARYGGEEFVVFLPKMDVVIATDIAERVRSAVENAVITVRPDETARITVSVGVASAPMDGAHLMAVVKAADRMLYVAKGAGRNRVVSTVTVIDMPVSSMTDMEQPEPSAIKTVPMEIDPEPPMTDPKPSAIETETSMTDPEPPVIEPSAIEL